MSIQKILSVIKYHLSMPSVYVNIDICTQYMVHICSYSFGSGDINSSHCRYQTQS